ncbi:aminotransferase class I/II-fold pyridoxal phosphate-dependent enzyme [Prolixibacteraceae bacterium JC049]|nr:aminotransferase class I/II-fold pyridoxal phosphate-dependent enzyme [Prolixibacteraceae bacterium JC049]
MVHTKLISTRKNVFSTVANIIGDSDVIDMTVGSSDFQCPEKLLDLANHFMRNGHNNYSPLEGVEELREVLAGIIERQHQRVYHPQHEITITAGSVQAATTAITSFVGDGDEVIIFEPTFDSYVPAVEINGARPVYVSLKQPDFHIDWQEVRKMISSKTKMIILNTPHNPTGAVISEEDIKQLTRLVNGTNIVILADESFEHLVYDNRSHFSVAKYPELAERSIVISSFGAAYNINGWGIAWAAAPQKLMKEFRKVHQFQVFNVNTPLQHALAEFLKEDTSYLDLSDRYQGKRNYFNRLMKDSLFEFTPTQGSYFQIMDYSNISTEDDITFAKRLAVEHGIAAVPVSVFQHEKNQNHLLRFCFAKSNETLDAAAERLCQITCLV